MTQADSSCILLLLLSPPIAFRFQFPTAAADPQAHGAKELPTLADALANYTLEQKIDHALEELRKKKEAQQKK
jgi:hypothetical protein